MSDEFGDAAAATLVRDGPIVSITLSTVAFTDVAAVPGLAMLDTGASRTCVDERALLSIGARRVGYLATGSAAGIVRLSAFDIQLAIPSIELTLDLEEVPGVDLYGWRATVAGITEPVIAIIGRDILARCVFTYDGAAATYSLTSR